MRNQKYEAPKMEVEEMEIEVALLTGSGEDIGKGKDNGGVNGDGGDDDGPLAKPKHILK